MSSFVLLFQGIAQALVGKPTPLSRAERRYLQTYGHCALRAGAGQRRVISPLAASSTVDSTLNPAQGATPSR
jgi:hypothetical protein